MKLVHRRGGKKEGPGRGEVVERFRIKTGVVREG